MNFRKAAANLVFGIGALNLGICILLPGLIGLGVAALHARKAEKVKAVAASGHNKPASIAI
ncbi:PTPA-CTERM sorting domain-containing protein [Phormidium sp. FACHB-592]|uniref:PTPA-CTERM sorting domain-containing protein n=1 Tax=Stenomitos frigidus AS-A4 TaxID=2933935 RepID=A0ABV0KW23_9CYAN|nr:PTPA-CTERM sorting domain-containing protein [Phormidium sp. FACHB-592]MBD2072376.1 PTPA-CTERM sorting domain-containing protein [Phormidium sp. FACHB-592]